MFNNGFSVLVISKQWFQLARFSRFSIFSRFSRFSVLDLARDRVDYRDTNRRTENARDGHRTFS